MSVRYLGTPEGLEPMDFVFGDHGTAPFDVESSMHPVDRCSHCSDAADTAANYARATGSRGGTYSEQVSILTDGHERRIAIRHSATVVRRV